MLVAKNKKQKTIKIMKTTIVKTILLVAITLVLVACGNDDDGGPTINQHVVSSNVKFTGTSGAVTIRDYNITYNADNMVSTYQYFGGSPYAVRDATITYNLNKKVTESVGRTFEYDANDRVVKITADGIRSDLETTLTYDDVGKIIRANGKKFENGVEIDDRVNTIFEYTNGVLTKITTTYSYGSGVGSVYTTDLSYDASGNISRIVQTSGSSGRETVRTINLTYDTHNEIGYNLAKTSGWLLNNQPVSLIRLQGGYNNSAKLFNQLNSESVGYASIYLYSKNNVLKREEVTEYENVVTRREVSTYNYTYNSANYPLTVTQNYTYERTGDPTRTATTETTYTYEEY